MKVNEIDQLMRANEVACISIIIPTDRTDKRKNYELFKKSIQKAKALLKSKAFPDDIYNNIILKIERAVAHIPETLWPGLGIFISPSHHAIITFPFEVKLKVIVGNTFEIRDLLYLKQYSSPYYVLNLSKKGVHFFKGVLNELEEIKDGKFPLVFEDHFEYERASIANSSTSSLKGFEKDKNEISEIRLKAVFRDADALIKSHISSESKILLAGTQRMISLYHGVTNYKNQLAGKISGSFNENNFHNLSESAWHALISFKKSEISKLIKELDEKNNRHVAEGLLEAWNAANEGKGLTLFVEKDLHHRAYRKEDLGKLHLQPPKKPYTIVSDVVDDLIKTVQNKNGKVLFTENDQLKQHDHLALILRY